MKALAFSLFVCIVLSGCQSNPSRNDERADWWLNPPQDDENWLYGLGEGATLESANQQALANIAGKLRTNISSSLSRRTQESSVVADDFVDRNISSKITEIPLSNYETVKIQNLEFTDITLVRVNKTSLANDWLIQHNSISQDINNVVSENKSNRFKWWVNAKAMNSKAAEGDYLAELYSSLSGTVKDSHLSKTLNNALVSNKPSVSISGKFSSINQALKSELIKEGLNASNCRKCDLTVAYSTTFSSDKLFGESIVRLNFSGALKDRDGVFASKQWSLNASSVQGNNAGQQATLFMAVQKIKDEGLWKAFGMEAK